MRRQKDARPAETFIDLPISAFVDPGFHREPTTLTTRALGLAAPGGSSAGNERAETGGVRV
jgi:hypothetical protein